VIGEPMAARFRHSSRTQPVVIPNWALEERAEEGAITPDTRPGHGLRTDWGLDGKLVVGYSGNMGRAHRLHELIDAAADMHDETEVRFLLIGDGAQRNSLIARTRALGLENVIFRPYQARESLRESLSVPDVHIVSLDGRLEGLIVPSKFVGVLAMGRPVLWIGAPDGEIGTLVRSSGCGISVAPGDVSGLISQLRELVADYKCGGERIKRMSSRAHMLWQERFTRRNALQMWSSMIASCGRRNE
jgi:glycosyltransferase involved in cell wall biosynthesis